jgi:hypothetical protein
MVACLSMATCSSDSTANAIGPSPTGPSNPVSVSGSWAGQYTLTCPTSPTCDGFVSQALTNSRQPMSLVLQQTGSSLSGQINLSGWVTRVANVLGTVAADGTMSLQGSDAWSQGDNSCSPAGRWQIESWSTHYDASRRAIVGTFGFSTQHSVTSCYFDDHLMANATNVVLAPAPVTPATFTGHWSGNLVIDSCVPVGFTSCHLDYVGNLFQRPSFDLLLTQTGNSVAGTLSIPNLVPVIGNAVPVTGVIGADGATITALSGSAGWVISGGTETVRLTAWSTSRDSIGRLIGTFSFVDEVDWNPGVNGGAVYSKTYNVELQYVVVVP